LIVNKLLSPSLLGFWQSGWIIPTLVFLVISVSSSLAATFLSDTMARIPGNSQFDLRIEFGGRLWGVLWDALEKGGAGHAHGVFVIADHCWYRGVRAGGGRPRGLFQPF
jgi:hypothetical protein